MIKSLSKLLIVTYQHLHTFVLVETMKNYQGFLSIFSPVPRKVCVCHKTATAIISMQTLVIRQSQVCSKSNHWKC